MMRIPVRFAFLATVPVVRQAEAGNELPPSPGGDPAEIVFLFIYLLFNPSLVSVILY
jgi:hypothetical protein